MSARRDEEFTRRSFLRATTVGGTGLLATATSARPAASQETKPAESEPFRVDRHPLLVTQNPKIIAGRDAALAVLKPTRAELDRGLTLHHDSVVFDTYGFAPRAAIDGAAFDKLASEGASIAELQDLREEMSMTRAAHSPAEADEFREAFRCAGVTCIFQNSGEEGQDIPRLLKRLARFTYLTDNLRDTLVRATRPEDVEAAKQAGRNCLYLTGNGVPLPQLWNSAQEELGYIRIFYQLGIRMMHLTYNRRNMLGDGCAEPANGGISDFGRMAIEEMNRVGVIVDVAHSGWQTSLEAAKASSKPMVASHTVCDAVRHHIRAKPDEVIAAICDTGGLIGLCWISSFVGGQGGMVELLDHIDYAAKKFGTEHIGVGTDTAHMSQLASSPEAKTTFRTPRSRTRFGALWPEGSLGGNWPARDTLAWTNWPLLTVGLVQRGYSDEQIRQIIGGNMLRVCQDALPQV